MSKDIHCNLTVFWRFHFLILIKAFLNYHKVLTKRRCRIVLSIISSFHGIFLHNLYFLCTFESCSQLLFQHKALTWIYILATLLKDMQGVITNLQCIEFFGSLFVTFSSDSPKFLHVVFSFFRKYYLDISSTLLRFILSFMKM